MKTSVNLLRKAEERYQGPISRKFIIFGSVCLVAVLLLLVVGTFVMRGYRTRLELSWARERWAGLEPIMQHAGQQQKIVAVNAAALGALEKWKSSRYLLASMLAELRLVAPENIQFTSLSVASDRNAPNADAVWNYTVRLDGRAEGEKLEELVVGFRRLLLTQAAITNAFSAIRLVSFRKDSVGDGREIAQFTLQGEGKIAPVQPPPRARLAVEATADQPEKAP